MKPRFQMEWDLAELAHAFRVHEQDIREYLTDGRRASFIIERRLKWEHQGWHSWRERQVSRNKFLEQLAPQLPH